MTVQTQVIWNTPLSQETIDQCSEKSRQLIADGKEIGDVVITEEGGQQTVNRVWVDQAAALEWVAFVEQFGPVSATIIN